jgi:outer membrane protein OmpA-like peptidoglycan-associated protein/opacity protein-like surface antigen
MRKFAAALALATTALAGPALARDNSWYIGLEAGPNLTQNELFDIARPAVGTTPASTVQDGIRARHEIGYDVGGNIGYDFGGFRAEFEVAYKDNNLDQFNVEQAVPPIRLANNTLASPALGAYPLADGNARVLSFMVNGLFDFGGKDRDIGGFIGGGAGIARVQHSDYQFAKFGPAFMNDSDTGFAYQILAGVYKPISDHVDIGLKYRFFTVPTVDSFTTNGLATETRYRSHSLLLTLTYNFFEPAPPPPPPAPPAPPPPPPVAAPLPPCPPPAVTPGPFLVFFDWDKSAITADASAILDRAAEQFAATGQTSVALAGHADKSGKDDYNVKLSQRRADAVKAYLATKGVPDTAMATEAFGESRPLVDTADGVREPQNRRVEITFSGAPAPATGPCTPQ